MKRSILLTLSMAALVFLTAKVQADGGECANNFTTTSLPAPSSLHVGVILVQFSDWQDSVDSRGSHCFIHGFDNDYTYQEFNRHLFSQDSYSTAIQKALQEPMTAKPFSAVCATSMTRIPTANSL